MQLNAVLSANLVGLRPGEMTLRIAKPHRNVMPVTAPVADASISSGSETEEKDLSDA